MLTEFQEVFFLKLLYLICALHFVRIATRFDRETVWDLPVAEDAQARTILLVLLVAKFAVVVLEVG